MINVAIIATDAKIAVDAVADGIMAKDMDMAEARATDMTSARIVVVDKEGDPQLLKLITHSLAQ